MILDGGCHCGNLSVRYETAIPPGEAAVRLCQCSFCRKHASRAATDPGGHLTVEVRDRALLSSYVFGLRTSEFLVCARCGLFVAAVMEHEGKHWATVNVNVLERAAEFAAGSPVEYDAEDAAARIARRRKRWTPATITTSPAR